MTLPSPSSHSSPARKSAFREPSTRHASEWFEIAGVESFDPFLVSIVSADDHWLFAASNGALAAGRCSPDMSLFPYYTQDKLIDLAASTGPVTRLAWTVEGERCLWRPFDARERSRPRSIAKRLDGTRVAFSERHEEAGLEFSYAWGFSRRFGFVRQARLRNLGSERRMVELLDGLQNLMPCGVSADFQNEYSILVDAYKRVERVANSRLRLVYLSSIPTDRAEPSEALRATTVWACGWAPRAHLLTTKQIPAFEDGRPLTDESESRGRRAAVLDVADLLLEPGECRTWYTVAEVGQSTARVQDLKNFLQERDDAVLAAELEREMIATSERLRSKVASADGLQLTRQSRRVSRHYSNVMFNVMRGGVFLENGRVRQEQFSEHLAHFNREVSARHAEWVESLPESLSRQSLVERATATGDAELERLAYEYLPLTFSRRHGDPSRPWNRFAIQVSDPEGRPRFAYQGNWRDIFQNWETLMHAFPGFVEGAIFRFLNATTADGYNPYRVTHEGFDWETIDPDEPWSNIGYWGDHQIVYLLRLLQTSRRFHPERLTALLSRPLFTYARVPYRIRHYTAILENPRSTIDYDDSAAEEIRARVGTLGGDGRLLPDRRGGIVHVNLLEKLLVPIMAKLSNFVPGGGIWMNTQRPEWNDANNALVGYGISVVTMAYCHRYLGFLLDWLEDLPVDGTCELGEDVLTWFRAQREAFSGSPEERMTPTERRRFLDTLGESASAYRHVLYERGPSGAVGTVPIEEVRELLAWARTWLASSLRENERGDGLFHSYNLLRWSAGGGVEVDPLDEMLEGQVAILSAGLLAPAEALRVMRSLRQSRLYREDQASYLLYPDRDLPRFLDKNRIDPEAVESNPLLRELARESVRSVIETAGSGTAHFGGELRNAGDLRAALESLPSRWDPLVRSHGEALVALFEETFRHREFTGRSGAFFAYEGLGSIYWHMVSKLVLAIQENTLACAANPDHRKVAAEMADFYEETLAGLGMEKDPRDYGAFPTDAYSHTPRHAGAQQPGMTGQVKEDILVRWGELGVMVAGGCLEFCPRLLSRREFLGEPREFAFVDVDGNEQVLAVPADALAFTFCQVPILYRLGTGSRVVLTDRTGASRKLASGRLPQSLSQEIFDRMGNVRVIEVEVPADQLRESFFGPPEMR